MPLHTLTSLSLVLANAIFNSQWPDDAIFQIDKGRVQFHVDGTEHFL